MGEWSFLGDLLEAVNAHSTMTGRLWLMIFIIFRVLVIATIGDNLYEDEQEAFICNTLQPGCNQVCYDKAFPMSHFRFWVFQIVVLAAPSLSFIAFAIHSQTKEEKAERIVEKKPFQSMEEQKKWEKSRSNREARRHAMYAVHVVLKLVLEIGCLVSQYFVYGFTINAHFPCERFPCPNKVDCFVSRPTEKNVFLLYYFVVNVFSALLCFVEINLIGLKTLRRRLKHVVGTDSDEEYNHAPPSFSSAVTFPDTKRMNGHVVSVAMQNIDHLSVSTRDISRQQNMSNAAHENSTSMMEPLLMEMQRQSEKSGNGLIRSRAGSQSVLST
ncbi:gap junction delta-3 protein-like [Petromyzon marinus]|uniref:Gap junction protein n=1 Tax=Petromyzon marinus TaxID=7757 RepID=A0AAJ7WZQ5_PETMA|nr:gap junction delta-3 protein-like [Petromyzon marinus]